MELHELKQAHVWRHFSAILRHCFLAPAGEIADRVWFIFAALSASLL